MSTSEVKMDENMTTELQKPETKEAVPDSTPGHENDGYYKKFYVYCTFV